MNVSDKYHNNIVLKGFCYIALVKYSDIINAASLQIFFLLLTENWPSRFDTQGNVRAVEGPHDRLHSASHIISSLFD